MQNTDIHRNITFWRLLYDFYQGLRSLRCVVKWVGKPFVRSRRFVEIDITYRCNLSCANCNRSCTQAPSRKDLPVSRIETFLAESIAQGITWERIRLLGGEPTLHPELMRIIDLLAVYQDAQISGVRIEVCTNGCGEKVNRMLSMLPGQFGIKNTYKTGRDRLFRPFNQAPVDSRLHRFADYSVGCRIIRECGLGLTPMGYYPCAIAGGIDRIFEFGLGRRHLPSPDDDMEDLLAVFCPLCGHFGFAWPIQRAKMSKVWKEAYARAFLLVER
jgi:hypothetical protein